MHELVLETHYFCFALDPFSHFFRFYLGATKINHIFKFSFAGLERKTALFKIVRRVLTGCWDSQVGV